MVCRHGGSVPPINRPEAHSYPPPHLTGASPLPQFSLLPHLLFSVVPAHTPLSSPPLLCRPRPHTVIPTTSMLSPPTHLRHPRPLTSAIPAYSPSLIPIHSSVVPAHSTLIPTHSPSSTPTHLNLLPLCWFIFARGATPSTAM